MNLSTERADFDCNLFGYEVGRVELEEEHAKILLEQGSAPLYRVLEEANDAGFKLLYLMTPNYTPETRSSLMELESCLLGNKVDFKTTYKMPVKQHLENELSLSSEKYVSVKIIAHHFDPSLEKQRLSPELRDLAIMSGEYSRFKVDEQVPNSVYEELFEAWIQNSINRTLAEEVFIAVDEVTGKDVGMITLKRKGPTLVDVGLLAVSSSYRRKGIASRLLRRAGAWAEEKVGSGDDSVLQVVTQGLNEVACKAYERFGFAVHGVQIVNHVWLPKHLDVNPSLNLLGMGMAYNLSVDTTDTNNKSSTLNKNKNKSESENNFSSGSSSSSSSSSPRSPAARADRALIPYCRQYLTGKEKIYINEILDSRLLDSTSRFTTLCSAKLKCILNDEDASFTSSLSPTSSSSLLAGLPAQGSGNVKQSSTAAAASRNAKATNSACSTSSASADTDTDTDTPVDTQCEQVLVTNSGTAALEMAAILCNIEAGDEVIMPSYTFASTANAFVLRGAIPVFVDIRPDTLNIDETKIEAAVTSKTKAICVVHYAGNPCEMDEVCSIAERHNLLIVEDAAQGFLSTYKGRQLGTIGHFGCFSFHYTKNIICGEGGALSVNRSDKEAARRAWILWEKGTNRCDFMSGVIDKYEWVDVGSSHVPAEINCAILYAQLEECREITKRRKDNYLVYLEGLQRLQDKGYFRIPSVPSHVTNNAHIFYIILPSKETRLLVEAKMRERGIAVFSHYVPLHSAPAGRKYGRVGSGSEDMEVTQNIFAGLLRLPVWVGLKEGDLRNIMLALETVCEDIRKM